MVAWPLSPERARTEWASRSDQRPAGLRLEQGEGLGRRVGPGDRRDHGRAVGPEDLAEVGVGGVLVEDRQGHRAVLGQGLDRLVAEGGVGEVLEDHVGGVGPGLARARSPRSPNSTTSRRASGLPPTGVDQPGGGDVPEVAGDGLGPVGPEQLVDVSGVDPEQDQGLVERQGPAQGVEDRAVELDQGEAVEPLDPEGVEGERAVVVEGPDRRAEVGRARLQADEA